MEGGCFVSWCPGHLAELASADAYDKKYAKWQRENLPILPESRRFTVEKDKQKQFDILRALMCRDDVDLAFPRDRKGEFKPQLIQEHQIRIS